MIAASLPSFSNSTLLILIHLASIMLLAKGESNYATDPLSCAHLTVDDALKTLNYEENTRKHLQNKTKNINASHPPSV